MYCVNKLKKNHLTAFEEKKTIDLRIKMITKKQRKKV
jgi:hypothetical protein